MTRIISQFMRFCTIRDLATRLVATRLVARPFGVALLGAAFLSGCQRCESDNHAEHGGEGHEDHDDHEDHDGHKGHEDDEASGHKAATGHDHEPLEDAISVTRWTSKLELFAEHSRAAAGQELKFLVHLTILDGFRALENATVTLVMDGPVRAESPATKVLRPGIFELTLKAPPAGTYRCRLEVVGADFADIIDGFEVEVSPGEAAAEKTNAKKTPRDNRGDGADVIHLLKEQQWKVPFGTAFAREDSVSPTIEVAGEVSTPPRGQADVGAAIAGRLVAPPQGLKGPGETVKRGELLATIAPAPAAPEEGARAELAVVEAKARAQAAQAAVERAERLIRDQAISEREVEDARRELGVAEEAVKSARRVQGVFAGSASGSGAGSYRVTSPIDGVIVEVSATTGKSVKGGDPLFRVVNLEELWLVARVPEQQAALIRSEKDAAYQLPGVLTWLPLSVSGEGAIAEVVNVGRTVDRRSRTVDVIYGLKSPDARLRVGAMVRVAVPVGDAWKGVVVPRGAVLDDEGNSVVYVQVAGELFEERLVRLGPSSGALVGILSGVSADERVVTLGANVVRLSARAGAAPSHGHVH
jgi:cobalt-zinc-cadmium efflux system membrane fusion protein